MTISIENLAGVHALNRRQLRHMAELIEVPNTETSVPNLYIDQLDQRLAATPRRKHRQVREEITADLPFKVSFNIRDHIPYIANLRLLNPSKENPSNKSHIAERYEILREKHEDRGRALKILKDEINTEMDRLSREEDMPAPFKKEDLSSEILLQLIRSFQTITKPNWSSVSYDAATRDISFNLIGNEGNRTIERRLTRPLTKEIFEAEQARQPKASQSQSETIKLIHGQKRVEINPEDIVAYTLTKALDEVTSPIRDQVIRQEANQRPPKTETEILNERKFKHEKQIDLLISVALDGLNPAFIRALVDYTRIGQRSLTRVEKAIRLKNNEPTEGVLITVENSITKEQFEAGLAKIRKLSSQVSKSRSAEAACSDFNYHLLEPKNTEALKYIVENVLNQTRLKILKRIPGLFGVKSSEYFKDKLKETNPNFTNVQSVGFPNKLASKDPYAIFEILNKALQPELAAIDSIEAKLLAIKNASETANKQTLDAKDLKTPIPNTKNNKFSKSLLSTITSFFPIRFISNLVKSALGDKSPTDVETQIAAVAQIKPQTNETKVKGLASKLIDASHKLFGEDTTVDAERVKKLSQHTVSFLSRFPSIMKNIIRALGLNAPSQIKEPDVDEKQDAIDEATINQDPKDQIGISNRTALLQGTAKLLAKKPALETSRQVGEKQIIKAFVTDVLKPNKVEIAKFDLAV